MSIGKKLLLLALVAPAFAACSSSGGDGNAILSVTQDLDVDPSGQTTVIAFKKAPPANLGPGNFTADAGQLALAVDVDMAVATVTWDERVTPSHEVTPVAIAGVGMKAHAVTTTDSSAPTFAITSALQGSGLGNDTMTVEFSGAHVVPEQAEDPASYELVVNGEPRDLTGSDFDFDEVTQTLTVALGPLATLHAAFDLSAPGLDSVADVPVSAAPVTGAATGDTTAPTFTMALQNLTESEFGFAVDFGFSEAMDPVFAPQLVNFDAGFPVFASSVEQVADTVLRATFTSPIVPGLDTVTLGGDLMDAHGNALVDPGGPVAVAAGSTVANGYDTDPVLAAVENQGGDTLSLLFTQALDPDTAEEFARWDVQSPAGSSLDLSAATLTYDLLEKTLVIELGEDVLTGDTFQVGPSAGPDVPVDVDGQAFASVFGGTVTGDAVAPSVEDAIQDRDIDPTGLTYDVVLSEQVAEAEAEDVGNWSVTGGAAVQSATLLPSLASVRLVLDAVALPGEDTLSADGLVDLAGNAMPAPQTGIAIVSTDNIAPSAAGLSASAVEGNDNDQVAVTFDDDMLAAEVETALDWAVEMPPGTPLDTTNATVVYTPATRTAVLTFDGGDEIDLKLRQDVKLTLSDMRDIGGNPVSATPLTAEVGGDAVFPELETVWVDSVDPTRLHVQFSEPMDFLDDLAGSTVYTVRDALGSLAGTPSSAIVDADRAGATLLMGFAVVAGTHTLDAGGATDLAGNALFPAFDAPVQPEDATEPGLDAGLSTAVTVSGESNDVLTVQFDRPMSAWEIADPAHYELSDGTPLDLEGADFAFDGDSTLTIRLDSFGAPSLQTGTGYTLTIAELRSRQGVLMSGSSADVAAATGDGTPAAQTALRTRLDAASPSDSVLIEFDEAVDAAEAADAGNYLKSGVTPDTATLLGPRTVRATWSGGVTAGEQVDVTMTDLAGNAGATSQLVQAAVSAGPALQTVAGVIAPGYGGDRVLLAFSVPVSGSTASSILNYALDQNGSALSLAGAALSYTSATNTVVIELSAGVELDPFQPIHAVVTNIANDDGIAINPPGDLYGSVTGDATPPDFLEAFVNHREDATGRVLDVLFTEDVEPAFAETPAGFTLSGGQTVVGAELLSPRVLRLSISAPLGLGSTLGTSSLPDAAGITSGAISIAPAL
jgi:hypothetical protein